MTKNCDFVLSIDQGTTSCRAIIYDTSFQIVGDSQKEFKQIFPNEGWVEHDPIEIWNTQLECCLQAISNANISASQIKSIGITNQRETIVAWNRSTGIPIYNAIVWQDRRTANDCVMDIENLSIEKNQTKTGLNIDAYFSAPKIRWILENISEANELIASKNLCVGTIDSWLIWNLTKGRYHLTDFSNASRTNLFHIKNLDWDQELLNYYQIDRSILPSVVDSIGSIGKTDISVFGVEIQISSIAGDQQASLYGHQCCQIGSVKNTFGTGCFLLQNIGNEFKISHNNLLTTIAWKYKDELVYAIEGSVFNAGSALKWLKENLGLISGYDEIDSICNSKDSTDGVVVVPAFTGLGAPYWDMNARGTIIGIHRNTQKSHIVRATVESLAFQTRDIVETMEIDSGQSIPSLYVDGGVSQSDFLLQFLADVLQIPIIRSNSQECTALGVAMMAAEGVSLEVKLDQNLGEIFHPRITIESSNLIYSRWKKAVERSMNWA